MGEVGLTEKSKRAHILHFASMRHIFDFNYAKKNSELLFAIFTTYIILYVSRLFKTVTSFK